MSGTYKHDTNGMPPELVTEAATWCARMNSDNVSAEEKLALEGWLADDPRRRAAFDAMSRMIMDPALVAALQESASNPTAETSVTRRLPSVVRLPGLAAAIGLLSLLVCLAWPWLNLALTPQTLVVTRSGETRTVVLADGSRLELSGGTSLLVRLGAARRAVRMQQGEVFFTVARDADRPFIVETEDGRVQVRGTAFDLSQTRDGLEIAVHHGRVAFGPNGWFASAIDLVAGEKADLNDSVLSPVKPFDVNGGDWRSGWLQTDGVTLGGLAERLGRRHNVTVSVEPALTNKRIAGRFRLNDPEALLRKLAIIHGFSVTRSEAGLHVSRHPAAT
ncbi:FecR domain-containing protein [Steroidobacter sp. S1-65]|uniref:FecR domain-containing protein n=1 Tax=Steroidobacter gossypii TaxID=2805490 RepID=A0ABS1WY06_9GAMM|nr:FecR domain-containing protein [Steroidobacter gossypii]MBM0105854.1 FecR domain-containing protein [Steroidobacter gossypii]